MPTKRVLYSIILACLSGCGSLPSGAPFVETQNNIPEGQLYAQFFGASTLLIGDGYNSIMIDGFFTRQSLLKAVFNRMKTDEGTVSTTLCETNIENIDLVLVSHSHYDHALDSGYIADVTDATLMGSSTTLSISPANKQDLIDVNETEVVGKFNVSFYETKHGRKPNLIKFFEPAILWATGGLKFKEHAEVYTFFIKHPQADILIIPSSNFTAINEMPIEVKADIVFLGVGLLSKQNEDDIIAYWQKAVIDTGAKWVIPIHWDDFSKQLNEDMVTPPSFIDKLERTMDILNKLSAASESKPIIAFPPVKTPFLLNPLAPILDSE